MKIKKIGVCLFLVMLAMVPISFSQTFDDASPMTNAAQINSKLDEIIAKQDEIQKKLEELGEKIDVVRVRASR